MVHPLNKVLESGENGFDAKISHLNHIFHRFFLIAFYIFCENLGESGVKTKNRQSPGR